MSAKLDQVAAAVRYYIRLPPEPWPDSISAREQAREDEFVALPMRHPMVHTQVAPLQYLGSAQDHLTAMAAAVRTPLTVMASLTLLRTLLVGAANAAYLADPKIDAHERVRRALNFYLESLTEQMRLFGRDDPLSVAEYDRLEQRRKEIKAGAKQLGWTVRGNDTPKATALPKPWHIEPKPAEMTLLNDLLVDVMADGKVGHTLYRWLSATSHVQPHALLGLINKEHSVSQGDGSTMAAIGMDGNLLLTLSLIATGSLTLAMDRCIGLYGWSSERWRRDVVPLVNDLRTALGVPPSRLLLPRS